METNIINNLTTQVMNCYDIHKVGADTFANQGMWEEAELMVRDGMNKAYGAMEFAMMMCHENGYPDIAKEIMDRWNNMWSIWFSGLMNAYDYE